MRIRKTFVALLVSVLLFAPELTKGAAVSDEGYITGVVLKSGHPVSSVWVIVNQGSYQKGRSLTGDDGRYYVERLEPGTYEVLIMSGTVELFRRQVDLPRDRIYNIQVR
jgi:hypothetical protein